MATHQKRKKKEKKEQREGETAKEEEVQIILKPQIQQERKYSKWLTTKGKSQEVPLPVWRAAIVVGPASEGIQKKPSVRSPLKIKTPS